jgi:diaminohydroxyphosphoribosylaminopyrimidine deaminase/5-amino-6-(5-phosphoribosylamino)uracil reductase
MTSLLEQKLADKVYLTVSPKITGGDQALPLLGGRGVDFIKDSIRLKNQRSFRVEEDIIIEGYL